MSTGSIQQTSKKISKSSTTANISCCRGVNQLEMYLARRTFMQKEIAHCSPLLRTSMAGRWDKINCCHSYYVGLAKDAWKILLPSKQWSVKAREGESQSSFETVKRCTENSSLSFLKNRQLKRYTRLGSKQAGTKVGPDQLGPPVQVGSTRIDSDRLGSWKEKHKIKWNWNFYPFEG